ncbi:Rv3654c family TadE-like protein [Intrasporangium chromatireducens]|uniref:Rv3654c family TadE-like protein n=1 Tax=Intrasporangium chromatireducens TaxID=1386088 RepID=UPI0004B290D6|nr:Rv3654c family TadE-like protein [Intrasporangium chromatireducens]
MSVVMRPRAVQRDRGAASVLVIGVVAALLLLTAGAMTVIAVVAASHRARLAADLAAIGGALQLQGVDGADACAAAAVVAMRNGAQLAGCVVDGQDVSVTVHVAPTRWPAPAVARARAGPDLSTALPISSTHE